MVENSFGILVRRFRVLLTTMEQRSKVVRDICVNLVVLHNMLRGQGGADRQSTLADDIQPPQNDQRDQAQDENIRNPLREAKH